MGGWGWQNGWPYQWGGGSTFEERAYVAMRDVLGRDGAGPEDASIEDAWRRERAKLIGACVAAGERAANQAHPARATDALPYYEQLLALSDAGPMDERLREAARRFTEQPLADGLSLLESLQAIDPRFELIEVPREATIIMHEGRVFEDFAATLPFGGGRTASDFGLVSSEYHVHARLPVGPAPPSAADRLSLQRARALLDERLPAWVTYRLTTSGGVVLDASPMDVTGFGA